MQAAAIAHGAVPGLPAVRTATPDFVFSTRRRVASAPILQSAIHDRNRAA